MNQDDMGYSTQIEVESVSTGYQSKSIVVAEVQSDFHLVDNKLVWNAYLVGIRDNK